MIRSESNGMSYIKVCKKKGSDCFYNESTLISLSCWISNGAVHANMV